MQRLLILALALLLAACAHPPAAEAVRAAVTAAAAAAEKRDPGAVLEHVAADFTGNDGELDRAGLERLLRLRLLAGAAIGVSLGPVNVHVDGDRATAKFDVTLSDSSGRWLADHGATLAMVTGWRQEHGDWRCYNASYTGGDR